MKDKATVHQVHYLRWRMPPFMRQSRGLPHRLAQCMRPQGWVKVVNAALLSLINEACVNVCCATLLEWTRPRLCAGTINPRGGACRLVGRDRGYWVTLYLFIYTGRPATQHTSHRWSGQNVGGACGRPTAAYQHAARHLLLSLTRQWLITERHFTQ